MRNPRYNGCNSPLQEAKHPFFMYTGVQMKYVSRADGRPARRVGEVTFPTRFTKR